ncbi:MAG: hypothetical protein ORN55_01870 [Chitinophagaceae bacterium]|nr:hypothetical protein [Chitinophagaceae bacterium]
MKIKIIVLLSIIGNLCFAQNRDSLRNLMYNSNPVKENNMANNIPGAAMPIFTILKVDSTKYNTKDIPENKSAIVVLFNPNCEHCMEETKLILKNLDQFPNTQFVFVTGDNMMPYLPGFIKNTKYEYTPQLQIGLDIDYITPTIFAMEGIPQIMIYGRDKKLIDILYKDVPMSKIQSALNRDKSELRMDMDSPPQIIEKKQMPKASKKIFKKKRKTVKI